MLILSALAALFGIMGPFFQKEFVDLLIGHELFLNQFLGVNHWFTQTLKNSPIAFLLLSFVTIILSFTLYQIVIYLGAREALLLQRKWSQSLYNKILGLRSETLQGRPVGEIVSVYTTDLTGSTILLEQSLPQAFGILFPLLLAPLMIAYLFQTPTQPIYLAILFMVGLNLYLANRQSRFFYFFKKLAADRLGLVNEWVQNMRSLRILSWTRVFEKKIFQVRKIETVNRISMLINGQTMNAIASSVTFALNLLLLSALIQHMNSKVTPGALLALLWIIGVFLTRPFRQMPWFFTFVFDGLSSLQRTGQLFELENFEPQKRSTDFVKLKDLGAPDPALRVKSMNLQIKNKAILKDISFEVGQGEFVAIVGEVGSGKSMLLHSLLGETSALSEIYNIGANDTQSLPLEQLRQFFTFVPQEGFIMSGSLRENVAFEYDVDQSHDQLITQSLAHSQFSMEKERLSDGLNTEIGERGVNLSGGQKQRVSLARVDFYQAPIVLLDDCLSAVDVDTEKKLMQSLLTGAWRERTRILVTHRLSILEKVDRIFFMENGAIIDRGSYRELHKRNPTFREFVASIHDEAPAQDQPSAVSLDPATLGEK